MWTRFKRLPSFDKFKIVLNLIFGLILAPVLWAVAYLFCNVAVFAFHGGFSLQALVAAGALAAMAFVCAVGGLTPFMQIRDIYKNAGR